MPENERSITLPVYAKIVVIIIGFLGLLAILHVGRTVIVPFLFSLLLATLLAPLVKKLERAGWDRRLGIAVVVLGAMCLLGSLAYFISDQVMRFMGSMDDFRANLNALLAEVKGWVQEKRGIDREQMDALQEAAKAQGEAQGVAVVKTTIATIGSLFAFLFLLPVYTFFLLLYERLLLGFIARLFPGQRYAAVNEVLSDSQAVIQAYLLGLFYEALIVAVLNVTGLMIIGVEYAVLLGVLGAMLNMVPYVGGLIATGLAAMVALASTGPTDALWVLCLFVAVQFVDNNYIVPRIVASRVQVNALASIAVVMIGGALWDVPGMFLALPFTAIIKVICDRIPPLQPLGYLLGDEEPRAGGSILKRRKRTDRGSKA